MKKYLQLFLEQGIESYLKKIWIYKNKQLLQLFIDEEIFAIVFRARDRKLFKKNVIRKNKKLLQLFIDEEVFAIVFRARARKLFKKIE